MDRSAPLATQIAELSQEVALRVDGAGIIEWADARAERLLGLSVGTAFAQYVAPDGERKAADFLQAARTGATESCEMLLQTSSSPCTLAMRGAPAADGPPGTVVLVGSLVPPHYAALQEQLQEALSALATLNRTVLRQERGLAEVEQLRLERVMRQQESNALLDHADRLARSNDELERFAYVASHDLQEPLRMVVSYLQLLERRYKGKLDADADEFIGYAVDGAKRMKTLINDLLAYSRIGRQEISPADVDVAELLEAVTANLRSAIAQSGATITRDPLPVVRGDRSQLGQVWQNLLSNALKYRRPDEPPRIHLSATRQEDGWLFAVRDTGIGIAPAYFDRVFIIFQRLHSREQYGGSGIGLAICRKIIERHGGRIWVESEPGTGSTFYFTIPVRSPVSP